MRPTLPRWLRAGIVFTLVGVMLWFVGRRLSESAPALERAASLHDVPTLVLATILLAAATLCLGSAWIVLLNDLAEGNPPPRGRVILAFVYAWLGRYVPGGVPFLAGKVYAARSAGYEMRPVVVATAVQGVLEVLVSTVLGAALLVASLGATAGGGLYIALGAMTASGIIMTHPSFLRPVINGALRLARRAPIDQELWPSGAAMRRAAGLIIATQILNGTALLLILRLAAGGAGAGGAFLTIGAASLSGVAGVLVVVAPAGLGVRDGALTALLATRFAIQAAALAAVLLRILTAIEDLVLVALALTIDIAGGHRVVLGLFRGGQSDPPPVAPAAHRDSAAAVRSAT